LKIDHINIAAPSALLEKVRDFYCTVLEMEEGFRPVFSSPGYWLYADDKPLIHLSECEGRRGAEHSGFLDHIAFRSNGLCALMRRLANNGIEYRVNSVPELNMTQLFFVDPANNGLEVNFVDERPSKSGAVV